MTRPSLFDLNPHDIRYYPFMASLDMYDRSFNTLNNLLDKICVPKKA